MRSENVEHGCMGKLLAAFDFHQTQYKSVLYLYIHHILFMCSILYDNNNDDSNNNNYYYYYYYYIIIIDK